MATIQIVVSDDEKDSLKHAAGDESLSNYIRRRLCLTPAKRGRTLKGRAASGQAPREMGVATTERQGAPSVFAQSRTTVSGQTTTFDDATPRLPGQPVRLDVDYSDEYSQ